MENTEGHKPHTPDYIKEMTDSERLEHMLNLGAKGNESQEKARVARVDATVKLETEITAKLSAIQVQKGITELDDKIAWMSEAIRILQSYGQATRVSNLDKILVDMVEVKTKIQLMLEGQVMTDTIWAGVQEIIHKTQIDDQTKETLLTKIHDYLSALIKEALAIKGTK